MFPDKFAVCSSKNSLGKNNVIPLNASFVGEKSVGAKFKNVSSKALTSEIWKNWCLNKNLGKS